MILKIVNNCKFHNFLVNQIYNYFFKMQYFNNRKGVFVVFCAEFNIALM